MTQHELRRGSDLRERIIQAIVSSGVESGTLPSGKQIRLFLQQYFDYVPVEDLQGRSEKTMARAALNHLEFGATRRNGQALLRIFNPTDKQHGYTSAYTFIEMVNDDMPFLVDSVTAAVNRQDLAVHITVHPVIRVRRDARGQIESVAEAADKKGRLESYIRFAVDRENDPQQLKLLEHEIRKVLADVRSTVRDWKKMRRKMVEIREQLQPGPPGADEQLREESQALLDWMVNERFTYLGYRQYALSERGGKILLKPVAGSGLGLLARDQRGGQTIELTREMRRITRAKSWLY